MTSIGFSFLRRLVMTGAIVPVCLVAPALAGSTFQVIHSFNGTSTGSNPNQIVGYQTDPTKPSTWALYGTTAFGGGPAGGVTCNGEGGCGAVYKLTPPAPGKQAWTQTMLHVFQGGPDGESPYAGVTFDASGALYGTTGYGGTKTGDGYGTAFRLTSNGDAAWTKTLLYDFRAAPDGAIPVAGLTIGPAGTVYGTTWHGGRNGYGTVFALTPSAGADEWTRTVLHNFTGDTVDGGYPEAPLLLDAAGTLYGTANFGAGWGNGALLALRPPAPGKKAWTTAVLDSFDGPDGVWPSSALIADASGALYGTTTLGGYHGEGAVYKLTPPEAGSKTWTETVLYSFGGQKDGAIAASPLYRAPSGALYGTTQQGGDMTCNSGAGCGVVFKLTPPSGKRTAWAETVLHAFHGTNDGGSAQGVTAAGLVADPAGALYGTAFYGGKSGAGTVFRIAPEVIQ